MPAKHRNKDFVLLDHTADIGLIAFGRNLKETFANAAKGMFSIITDLRRVKAIERRNVSVTAVDREALLVNWLNELVYLFDTENILVRKSEITELGDTALKAFVYGEKVDLSRHPIKIGIKAVTYHMLKVEQRDSGYRVRVIFDI